MDTGTTMNYKDRLDQLATKLNNLAERTDTYLNQGRPTLSEKSPEKPSYPGIDGVNTLICTLESYASDINENINTIINRIG